MLRIRWILNSVLSIVYNSPTTKGILLCAIEWVVCVISNQDLCDYCSLGMQKGLLYTIYKYRAIYVVQEANDIPVFMTHMESIY